MTGGNVTPDEREILERLAALEARVAPLRRQYPAQIFDRDATPGRLQIEERLAGLEARTGIRGAHP